MGVGRLFQVEYGGRRGKPMQERSPGTGRVLPTFYQFY